MARPSAEKLALLRKMLAQKGIEKKAEVGTIPKLGETAAAPLSNGQQRLWFLDQFDPGTALYNDSLALTIEGIELDEGVFRRALTEIVRRHEILRASFHTGATGPVQRISPVEEARLGEELTYRFLDLSENESREEELEALLLADVQAPFQMDRLPQLRALLVRVAERRWVFGLTLNHIISDGVSYDVLYRELGALYRAYAAGRESPLPELPIQFSDFAAWERERTPESRVEELLPFWKRYLGGDLPRQKWPAKDVAPLHRGAYHRFRFPEALYRSLEGFCRSEGVTSNWVLMAAYFVMLHTFGAQKDIRIGTPSSIRKHPELEGLIGFFVQTVILRVDLGGNPGFRGVIERTRQTALEVAKYEDAPFERVVQAIRPGREANQTPLIQAWIAPMKNLMEAIVLPGATSSYQIVDGEIARFDLALILDESRGGIEAFFEYDTDLFDAETIAGFEYRFLRILRQGVEHPDTTLELFRDTIAPRAPGGSSPSDPGQSGQTAGPTSGATPARRSGMKKMKRAPRRPRGQSSES